MTMWPTNVLIWNLSRVPIQRILTWSWTAQISICTSAIFVVVYSAWTQLGNTNGWFGFLNFKKKQNVTENGDWVVKSNKATDVLTMLYFALWRMWRNFLLHWYLWYMTLKTILHTWTLHKPSLVTGWVVQMPNLLSSWVYWCWGCQQK